MKGTALHRRIVWLAIGIAAVAVLCFASVQANANSTLTVSAGDLQDRFGNLMPTSGVAVLVADIGTNGFTDPQPAFPLELGATWGTEDKVIGLWNLVASLSNSPCCGAYWHAPYGYLFDQTAVTYTGGIAAGQKLQLYWFPSLTVASSTLGLTYYGKYTDTNTPPLDGSAVWSLPADGSAVELNFWTQSELGSNSNAAGRATLLTSGAADFSANPTDGFVPLTVTFTNTSAGPITNQFWQFGDGGTSTLVNPIHIYTNAGSFSVSLTVSGPYGMDTLTQTNLVSAQIFCPGSVFEWGLDFGQAPTGLVEAVSAGGYHALALMRDGTVVDWGNSGSAPSDLTGVIAIAAGWDFGLALESDGTVVGWGNNNSGQAMPPDGLAGVIAIAAGYDYSLALKSDGTVVGWGDNFFGQTTPSDGLAGVIAIAAGYDHSLALKSDGTVVGWGDNGSGDTTPPPGLTGVVAIAAGFGFSLALKSDGTVVGWGDTSEGRASPPVGLTEVVAIAAGSDFGLALKSDGTLIGWGDNDDGQLVSPAGLGRVVSLTAGAASSLAVTVVLSPPSALIASAVLSNQINLSWTNNSTIDDGFEIERAPDSGGLPGTWNQIATVGAEVTDYADFGLTTNTAPAVYWYRVRAYNVCTNSLYSDTASITTAAPLPTELYADAVSPSQVVLSWRRDFQNESGFQIERSRNAFNFHQIGMTGPGVTSYLDTNLTAQTTYYYRIRAYNATGESAYSNTNGVMTYAPTNTFVWIVSNTADSGTGSLRQTIQDANSGDSIIFATGVTGTVTLTSELLIDKNLNIAGPGMQYLAISGNSSNRVFNISSNATVAISSITISNGHAADGASGIYSNSIPAGNGENGGGICNHGTLTLTGCSVVANSGGDGGNGGAGSENPSSDLANTQLGVPDDSNPLDGASGGNGGGVYNEGSLILIGCTIDGNSTGLGGSGAIFIAGRGDPLSGGNGGSSGNGGGIYNAGSIMMTNCTFDENLTGAGGNGGVAFFSGFAGGVGAGAGLYNAGFGSVTFSAFITNQTSSGTPGATQNGPGMSGGSGGDGAALFNSGTFSADNSTFSGNSTGSGGGGASAHSGGSGGPGGSGGAVANVGIITITTCVFVGNSTGGGGGAGSGVSAGGGGDGGSGGGLQNAGTMNIIACTLSNNSAGTGGSGDFILGNGGSGGAIENLTTMSVTASTLNGNRAGNGGMGFSTGFSTDDATGSPAGNGGGIYNSGTLTVTSCTLTGNVAGNGGDGQIFGNAGSAGGGGAIFHAGISITIVACTIVGNSSGQIGSGELFNSPSYGNGGGIANNADPSTFNLLNTLISSNSVSTNATGPDVGGGITSLGHNLVSIADGSSGFTVDGDQTGTAATPLFAGVGPLQDNGGPTLTCLLLPGSPAIDAGDDDVLELPYSLITDQRGEPRLAGTHVDIGAVEVPLPDVVTEAATDIKVKGGTMNGSVYPNGSATTAYFRWGTTTNYSNVTAGMYVGNGDSWTEIHSTLSGLTRGVAYHFQVVASNSLGTAYGLDQSFTTFVDSDDDGIPNWWTQEYFHHPIGFARDKSRAEDDADGTGQNNLFKYVAGLDPTNPVSIFELRILSVANQPTQKELVFTPMVAGRTYLLEFSTDLGNGVWLPLDAFLGPVTNGSQVTITDMSATQSRKFYRVNISLP